MSTQSKAAFLKWLKIRQPRLYDTGMANASQLEGISDTISKVFSTVTDTVSKLGTVYVQGRAALELTKANIKRAKAGLSPVDSLEDANMGSGGALTQPGAFGLPQWAVYAGLGLVAFMIWKRR